MNKLDLTFAWVVVLSSACSNGDPAPGGGGGASASCELGEGGAIGYAGAANYQPPHDCQETDMIVNPTNCAVGMCRGVYQCASNDLRINCDEDDGGGSHCRCIAGGAAIEVDVLDGRAAACGHAVELCSVSSGGGGQGGSSANDGGGGVGGHDGSGGAGNLPESCVLEEMIITPTDLSATDGCHGVYTCDGSSVVIECDGENDGTGTSLCACTRAGQTTQLGLIEGEGEGACDRGLLACWTSI
ncbi:MAG: hypothetical protein U0271_01630 [Polyangiaceae bacterium]